MYKFRITLEFHGLTLFHKPTYKKDSRLFGKKENSKSELEEVAKKLGVRKLQWPHLLAKRGLTTPHVETSKHENIFKAQETWKKN